MSEQSGEIIVADRIFRWHVIALPGNVVLTVRAPNYAPALEAFFDVSDWESHGERDREFELLDFADPVLMERIIRAGLKIGWVENPFYPQDLRINGDEFLPAT